jgi:hypothetical protein
MKSFLMNDWVQAISRFSENHLLLVQGILIVILLPLIPKTWNEASNRVEIKSKKLLLTVASIVILATISFLLVISPRDYPTGH